MFTAVKILLLFIFVSCSHVSKKQASDQNDLVTVSTALLQARSSYLKGCVDAYRSFGITGSFASCVEKSKNHWEELNFIMEQDPEKNLPTNKN